MFLLKFLNFVRIHKCRRIPKQNSRMVLISVRFYESLDISHIFIRRIAPEAVGKMRFSKIIHNKNIAKQKIKIQLVSSYTSY